MKKRTATIILNRNLPEITNELYEHLNEHDGDHTDIFVVEAGSEENLLSKYATWHATWPAAREEGLRYSRGMNYALVELYTEGRFNNYDFFLFLANDTELEAVPTVATLTALMDRHTKVGILSPCSRRWGERLLLQELKTRYFWFIHNSAHFIRRSFIETINNVEDEHRFLFDGDNFRGFGAESELIAKAYVNDWAAAITTEVWALENESHLLERADDIRTTDYRENLQLYLEEGAKWMRKKYGFNSHWSMQQYVKGFYEEFFRINPELTKYKI